MRLNADSGFALSDVLRRTICPPASTVGPTDVAKSARKPFGGKSYGSIPHLPGSRIGPGDHHCHEGQDRICTTKARPGDLIIVQEKVDGSNVGVGIVNGAIVAVTRAGYLASTSPYSMHHFFGRWVAANESRFRSVLREGERICGEWLAQAHGTIYMLPHEPFVAFDIIGADGRRTRFQHFVNRVGRAFTMPGILSIGGPLSIAEMTKLIETSYHGAADPVEGAVWRVENKDGVDFLAKWVRPDKADGRYLPSETKGAEMWNGWPGSIQEVPAFLASETAPPSPDVPILQRLATRVDDVLTVGAAELQGLMIGSTGTVEAVVRDHDDACLQCGLVECEGHAKETT